MTKRTQVKGTVFSDFICPWCYIAERRLTEAAEDLGVTLDLKFMPFELNPEMPVAGITREQYRSTKFGSWERSLELDAQTLVAAKDDQVEIHYERIQRTPNTRRAHQLVQFASSASDSKQAEVVAAIFEAYFTQGHDIGSLATLGDIAEACGLCATAAVEFIESAQGIPEILAAQAQARSLGISGVPFFDFGKGLQMGGAQKKSMMVNALRSAAATVVADD